MIDGNPALRAGNLVRWLRGPSGDRVGVVAELTHNGRRARVQLDSGEEKTFVWPTDALERLIFPQGSHVALKPDGGMGVVNRVSETGGLSIYHVSLASGSTKVIPEPGVRGAVRSDPVGLLQDGELDSAKSTNLRVAATRLLFAHQFDDLSSLSNSRVEVKHHQVAVVHRVATTYPHRFLLADEVGLGKTIEAGLILKELKARGTAVRILVLAPSGIVSQWQFELKTKFNQRFALYNRATVSYLEAAHPGENVWTLNDNIIASAPFAAYDEERRAEIARAGWDMVILDEAHHARRTWQGANRYTETNIYKLASLLADPESRRSVAFLLLTATPMQLHPFELYSLVELLDPALFADFPDFENNRDARAGLNQTVEAVQSWPTLTQREREATVSAVASWLDAGTDPGQDDLDDLDNRKRIVEELAKQHRLTEILIRNRKQMVGGFQPRVARVWTVEMTDKEWEAYQATTEYVRVGYARSRATQNNALGFLMAILQKLNSSSSFALRESLRRRIQRLEEGLVASPPADEPEEEQIEELPTGESVGEWLGVDARISRLEELTELRRIVGLLDAIPLDTKAGVLLEGLAAILAEDPEAKVLIFTQFRDTQAMLARELAGQWGVHVFHGQLKPKDKDDAVAEFREASGPQLLISTEAGGEGRNFQFCHYLVNYDLPWNPMKIEQRIGRLDRIGQKHPVVVINFSVAGTIEERVLSVLSERIRVFEETIGGLDPILGDVESSFRAIFLSAEDEGKRALERLDAQLEERVDHAREVEAQLADFIMDTRSFRRDEVEHLLRNRGPVDSEAMRRFVLAGLSEFGVRAEQDPEVDGVYDMSYSERFLTEFPQFTRHELPERVTFDPSVALDFETIEFLAFGHEIVEALVGRVTAREYGGRASHRVVRTNEIDPKAGWFFCFVLEHEGLVRSKEVFPVFVTNGEIDGESGAWLLDRTLRLKGEEARQSGPIPGIDSLDAAFHMAGDRALERLLRRQSELEVANRERLEQERLKLERFFTYRRHAAEEKLASTQRVFDRVSESDDPTVQRIIPVWAKNLDTARRGISSLESDASERLTQLAAQEQVTSQHELIAASFVQIVAEERAD